jgi:hypothetical protein
MPMMMPTAPTVTPPAGPSAPGPAAQEGLRAQARVKLSQAVRLLSEALGVLKEVGSDEGRAILSALKALSSVTPEVSQGLGESELAAMASGVQAARPAAAQPPQGALGALGARPAPRVIAGPPMR